MGFIRIVPGVLIALSLSVGNAQTPEAPLSKEQRIKALRKALGGGGAASGAGETTAKTKEPEMPADYRQRALNELRPAEKAYDISPNPQLATVHTQEIRAEDPVYYDGLQVGVTAQYYQPQGQVRLITLGERDFGALPATVMTGLELRYMPFTVNFFGEHALGFRGGAAYAVQKVKLTGPSGKDLGPTKLHSIQTSAYLSQEWVHPTRNQWSWLLDAGAGHFDMIQTGESSLAQASDGVWLALLRTGPSYRLGPLWINLTYERRQALTRSWASMNENGVLLGVQYGIR